MEDGEGEEGEGGKGKVTNPPLQILDLPLKTYRHTGDRVYNVH